VADKTIIQKPLTRNQIINMNVVMGTGANWSATYIPIDATGAKIGQERSFNAPFGSDPDFIAWLTNVVVPALNAVEGT
jgi:hypothetical protein